MSILSGRFKAKKHLSMIVRKIVVTVLVGTFAYFLTERFLDDDGPWSIMASVFLGGVAFTAQFLVDVERRIDRLESAQVSHRAALDRRIDVSFRQISEATALHNLVTESNVPAADMAELIRAAVKVNRETPALAAGLATAELKRVINFMRQLHRSGEAAYEGEDRDWLLNLAQNVSTSIKATSLTTVDAGGNGFTDGGLWQTDLGMRYLEVQGEAIRRGVTIQRIFITDIPDINPEGPFLEICERQRSIGVDVRILNPHRMAHQGVNANALHDFIVFDDLLTYETTPAARPDLTAAPLILHTRLAVGTEKVQDRVRRFNVLWNIADRIPAVTDKS